MDRKLEYWVVAESLIAKHGDTAAQKADRRARDLSAEGDHHGAAIWKYVREAIEDLQRSRAGAG